MASRRRSVSTTESEKTKIADKDIDLAKTITIDQTPSTKSSTTAVNVALEKRQSRFQEHIDFNDDEAHINRVNSLPASAAIDLVTEVIKAEDESTLSPWTFRTWFIGTY